MFGDSHGLAVYPALFYTIVTLKAEERERNENFVVMQILRLAERHRIRVRELGKLPQYPDQKLIYNQCLLFVVRRESKECKRRVGWTHCNIEPIILF